jgi:excisionase family DNA binding protein
MEHLTIGETAKELGVSLSTVTRLVQRGVLIPVRCSSKRRISRFRYEDIEGVKDYVGKTLDLTDVAMLAKQASLSSRATERAVQRLMSVLGVDIPVLFLDEASARDLVRRAQNEMDFPGTQDVKNLMEWARTFYAMGEEHFHQLELFTEEPEPWKLFTELAKKLCTSISHLSIIDKEMEMTYGYLNMARRSMRDAAYFYLRTKYGQTRSDSAFPDIKSDPHEEILTLIFSGD